MKTIERIPKKESTDKTISVYFQDDGGNLICGAECSELEDENQYYFNRLFTKPPYRGNGHASKMLDRILQIITELNATLWLDINPYGDMDYEQLESFYIRHGFAKCNSNDFSGNSYARYCFKKEAIS